MSEQKWEKQPAWEGPIHQGCASCPPVEKLAPMDMLIAVGFGIAMVTKDGQGIYSERMGMAEEDLWAVTDTEKAAGRGVYHERMGIVAQVVSWTVADAEKAAAADPDHDWQIVLEAPLRSRTYQRQGPKRWVLIESGPGFA